MRHFSRLSAFIVLLCVSNSFAFPRFVLRAGETCTSCHVNPTGGGMRNNYGITKYSREDLPWQTDDKLKFSTQLTSNISIGADFRGQMLAPESLYVFQNGNIPAHAAAGGLAMQTMEASLYLNFQLSEKVSVYLKNDFISKDSYEYWAMFRVLPNQGYIKTGAFMPAVGMKVDDHSSFTRNGDYTQGGAFGGFGLYPHWKDVGIEVGQYFGSESVGNFLAIASLTNGQWPNGGPGSIGAAPVFSQRKNVLARIEYVKVTEDGIGVYAGASGLTNHLMGSNTESVSSLYGFFGGARYKFLTVIGDFEWGKFINGFNTTAGAKMIEGSAEITKGLFGIVKIDTWDPNVAYTSSNGTSHEKLSRFTFGFEFYPIPYLEFIPQFRIVTTSTDATAGGVTTSSSVGMKEILFQGHLWL